MEFLLYRYSTKWDIPVLIYYCVSIMTKLNFLAPRLEFLGVSMLVGQSVGCSVPRKFGQFTSRFSELFEHMKENVHSVSMAK